MKSSLIDAGPLIALFDRSDQHHQRVIQFLKSYKGRLITTWPVLTEVCYMLDFSIETQLDFLNWISDGGVEVYELKQWQIGSIHDVMEKYADLPADFADASLLQVAEEMELNLIITIDRDFEVYRNQKGKSLKNLLKRS